MTCLHKYLAFSGRAPRTEFLWFTAIYVVGAFAAFWIFDFLYSGSGNIGLTMMLLWLGGLFVPFIAVAWRRFHDLGRNGLPSLIPFIVLFFGIGAYSYEIKTNPMEYAGLGYVVFAYGGFLLIFPCILIWLVFPSQPGPNQYGPNPHEVTQ